MNKEEIYRHFHIFAHVFETDINEHLPTLREYAAKCDNIMEMGVRKVNSTWGLLAGLADSGGGLLHSIDCIHPDDSGGIGSGLGPVYQACNSNSIKFMFFIEDSLKIKIRNYDLLFIDTLHKYSQLKAELRLHHSKINKYIILHDTESFKDELRPAILEFLDEHKEWYLARHYSNNNGLTILEKKYEKA